MFIITNMKTMYRPIAILNNQPSSVVYLYRMKHYNGLRTKITYHFTRQPNSCVVFFTTIDEARKFIDELKQCSNRKRLMHEAGGMTTLKQIVSFGISTEIIDLDCSSMQNQRIITV